MRIPSFSLGISAVLSYQYIDDFGGCLRILVAEGVGLKLDCEKPAKALLEVCRKTLTRWGLQMHKEQYGLRIEPLGVVIGPHLGRASA